MPVSDVEGDVPSRVTQNNDDMSGGVESVSPKSQLSASRHSSVRTETLTEEEVAKLLRELDPEVREKVGKLTNDAIAGLCRDGKTERVCEVVTEMEMTCQRGLAVADGELTTAVFASAEIKRWSRSRMKHDATVGVPKKNEFVFKFRHRSSQQLTTPRNTSRAFWASWPSRTDRRRPSTRTSDVPSRKTTHLCRGLR